MISRERGQPANETLAGQSPLDLIRLRTSQCHQALENCIDWPRAFSSPAEYHDLLGRFLRVVQPLDERIACQLKVVPIDYDWQMRTASLNADIIHVRTAMDGHNSAIDTGMSTGYEETVDWVYIDCDYINCHPAAVGSLYVIEGSALGGQFLARQLNTRKQTWTCADGVSPKDLPISTLFLGARSQNDRVLGILLFVAERKLAR